MSHVIFAQWFGFVSLVLSLGILFNLEDAKVMAKSMIETESGYIMGGVQPIIFGTLSLTHHHIFQVSWQIVVTLIGLGMIAIGTYRVIFVEHWKKTMRKHIDQIPALFSLFGLIFALLLLYVGFVSESVHYDVNLLG